MKRWNKYNTALLATLTWVCLWSSSCQEEAEIGSALQQERKFALPLPIPARHRHALPMLGLLMAMK